MFKILLKMLFLLVFLLPISVYADEPIKILIVPGHDDKVWGSQYGNLKEADMNLVLATKIFNLLKKDKRFEVYITRNKSGYVEEFSKYFLEQKDNIVSFRKNAKVRLKNEIEDGLFVKKKDNVYHNTASEDTAVILYGINKWANEKNIDAVIHIHFNDYPRKSKWTMGEYKGFVIYVPEGQMKNSKGSIDLAKNIFTELKKKYIVSTYKKEKNGLVPEQSLIALGSYGTLLPSVRSILIEYGYIYRFSNKTFRQKSYKNMATLTAEGIKEYFSKN